MKYLLLAAIGASIVGFYLYSDKNPDVSTNSKTVLADNQRIVENKYTATQHNENVMTHKLSHGIHKPDY